MFEAVLIFILLKLIKHFSLGEHRIIIFICNPLVIIETYHSGHFDVIALMLFWLAILIFYRQRDRLFLSVLVMAILVKFLPLIMALPMLIKKFWRKLLLIIFAVTIILLSFSLNQTIPVAGFFSYANRWAFNGALFNLITELIDLFDFRIHEIATISLSGHTEIFYINKQFYYKIFALIVLLFIIYDQMRKLRLTSTYRSINYIRASFIITAALLLLVPTLHPWYVIIIIPFLIFTPNWSWLVFTFLVQLSYFVLQDYVMIGVWQESNWILLAEYLPFYGLLIFEYLDNRKIKGWFLE
jgi:hypothetical protein